MSLNNVIRYVHASDTTSTIGSGKVGLQYSDITAKYVVEGGTLNTLTTETITTLGTYQAPTSSGHIRIKELNGTVPTDGIYEVHFHDTQVVETNKNLYLFMSASGALFTKYEMPLYDIRGGVRLNSNGVTDAGSGVWTANPNAYSGVNQFGRELQPIYYADIKQYYDSTNVRDEYAVEWYRGNTPLSSGAITQARMSVYNTTNGAAVFENAGMSFAGPNIGGLRYNDASNLLTGGEPYQVMVSGTIDGSTRIWQRIIGRNKL